MHFESAAEAKVEYTAMLLGATGNVGGQILHLLVQSPLCKKVTVVTRRHVAELANPKVQQLVVNMDKLEDELAPHAKGVNIALVAFGVGKGSAKMADEDVRKIEITYPTAFASAAKAGGALVLAMMTGSAPTRGRQPSTSATWATRRRSRRRSRSTSSGFTARA